MYLQFNFLRLRACQPFQRKKRDDSFCSQEFLVQDYFPSEMKKEKKNLAGEWNGNAIEYLGSSEGCPHELRFRGHATSLRLAKSLHFFPPNVRSPIFN